jgi:ribosome maturation factor RimP
VERYVVEDLHYARRVGGRVDLHLLNGDTVESATVDLVSESEGIVRVRVESVERAIRLDAIAAVVPSR